MRFSWALPLPVVSSTVVATGAAAQPQRAVRDMLEWDWNLTAENQRCVLGRSFDFLWKLVEGMSPPGVISIDECCLLRRLFFDRESALLRLRWPNMSNLLDAVTVAEWFELRATQPLSRYVGHFVMLARALLSDFSSAHSLFDTRPLVTRRYRTRVSWSLTLPAQSPLPPSTPRRTRQLADGISSGQLTWRVSLRSNSTTSSCLTPTSTPSCGW